MDLLLEDDGVKRLSDGLHRICPARDTLARLLPAKHAFGITRLANVTGLDRVGLPVYLATRPNARSIAVSQGKGLRPEQAKASALMEAIEIWHAEHFDRPMHFASLRELADNHPLIDVDRLPKVKNGRFDDSLRMLWARGIDLMGGEPLLVPFEMVHADYTHPVQPGHGCFPASTNGLASGNHPLEAICHGICEVIERDALSLWHHTVPGLRRARGLDLSTVDDPDALAALRKFDAAGLSAAVWDLTSDVGIATCLCVVRESGQPDGHIGLGSGTHPDRGVALGRALTEAAQTRLNYISGSRDDLLLGEYSAGGRGEKNRFAERMMQDNDGRRPFDSTPSHGNATLKADLDCLLDGLRRAGIRQVAAIDLSRPDHGVPVVRIVVPGLEPPHDDVTYVPGGRALQGLPETLP
jgi:YcaO-like protein with predicted kinase domain